MTLTGKALKHIDSMQDDIPGVRRRRTQEWFNHVQPTYEDDNTRPDGILSQLYRSIFTSCNDILTGLEDSKAENREPMSKALFRVLDNVCDNLIEWGDEFEVAKGSLDENLKDSQDLRQFTIRIMIRICETLSNGNLLPSMLRVLRLTPLDSNQIIIQTLEAKAKEVKLIRDEASLHAQSTDSEDTESSSDGPTSDKSTLEDVIESLKSDVELLIDLGPSLEDPIRDTIVKELPAPPPEATELSKYQPFFDGIKQKYPQCDNSLAQSMSKALYETTIRLSGERQSAASPQATAVFRPKLPKDSGYGTSIRDENTLAADETPAAGSLYARTLASYAEVDEGSTRTPFPSQPKDLAIGQKFPCMACGRQVAKSERPSAWKRHLLSDLRPWVCCQVSCGCARIPYRNRNDWLGHLQAQHEVHPHWNDKKCPFCQRIIEAGGREMINHVERHLRQLSLAALTANPGEEGEDSDSDHESDTLMPQAGSGGQAATTSRQPVDEEESFKNHPLYLNAAQEKDGLWHCPWEGEGYCDHKPSVLPADFDKFVKQHLQSLMCKVEGCESGNTAFATQEILYLHEQKEHGMHKGGGRYLCTSPGCGRSRPGNGFANKWVQLEHIKNVHENIPDLPEPTGSE
ncbi:hypothetical protein QBC47DRAFT_153916 [Echria macrotheca]|uniref:C2H2-type domain-containing protein n=1 Tax=Echria macrotheca TaxID=438768 RepID=A0AAJ0F7W3_9PEZI|nr:hypothetical protein QBC47DRAFT_153916 [Echria macrotheca]